MKRIISIFTIAFAVLLFSCNQATDAANKTGDAAKGAAGKVEKTIDQHAGHDHAKNMNHAELKDHVCTAACKEAGKCVYACGEKGHVCTDACHADAKTNHKCTDKCTAGTHKCGDHCGCGDSCACTAENSCSDQCKIKKG